MAEGDYWEGAADVCGQVTGSLVEGDQGYLKIRGTGTKSEAVLKYLTGSRSREFHLHLCGNPCGAKVWRDGLLHTRGSRR